MVLDVTLYISKHCGWIYPNLYLRASALKTESSWLPLPALGSLSKFHFVTELFPDSNILNCTVLPLLFFIQLYFSLQKCFVFLIIAHIYSSTKLEKRAKQVLPASKGGLEGEGGSRGQEGEMAPTMYAYMNK
jgi:hypothetical protein